MLGCTLFCLEVEFDCYSQIPFCGDGDAKCRPHTLPCQTLYGLICRPLPPTQLGSQGLLRSEQRGAMFTPISPAPPCLTNAPDALSYLSSLTRNFMPHAIYLQLREGQQTHSHLSPDSSSFRLSPDSAQTPENKSIIVSSIET